MNAMGRRNIEMTEMEVTELITSRERERVADAARAVHARLARGAALDMVFDYEGARASCEVVTDGIRVEFNGIRRSPGGDGMLQIRMDEATLREIGRIAVGAVSASGMLDPMRARILIAAEAEATPEALRALRETLKMTYREVEEAIGIGFSYVSKIEKGKIPTRPGKIREIMDALAAHRLGQMQETPDGNG
jgi:hypothetical protein